MRKIHNLELNLEYAKCMIKYFFPPKGFVVVENFFKPEELEPCKRDIEQLVENVAQKLYQANKINGKLCKC